MDVWHLGLYALASFLALRSLVSLMTQHRSQIKKKLLRELELRQQAVGPALADADEASASGRAAA
jgi:hypothetical protein